MSSNIPLKSMSGSPHSCINSNLRLTRGKYDVIKNKN